MCAVVALGQDYQAFLSDKIDWVGVAATYIGLPFFLAVSGILFSIGLLGVLLRRSPLTILLSLEVMLNSVNLTLVAFSRQVGGSDGQVFALVVMGIAAAEVVVGLGLVVAMTRREMVLDTDELRSLSG